LLALSAQQTSVWAEGSGSDVQSEIRPFSISPLPGREGGVVKRLTINERVLIESPADGRVLPLLELRRKEVVEDKRSETSFSDDVDKVVMGEIHSRPIEDGDVDPVEDPVQR
jgi:hypothetical protein